MSPAFPSFRHAMACAHTWMGLAFGFVLMLVFFFGTLSVFDREIDRWSMPATRFAPQALPSFDKVLLPAFQGLQPDANDLAWADTQSQNPLPAHFDIVRSWRLYTTHRDPVINLMAEYEIPSAERQPGSIWASATVDPRNGELLPDTELKIGTEFFYPLHYTLNLHWNYLGLLIVGFATFALLIALISGVVIHRRFFRDFFTLRNGKNAQRNVLDLHNLTGVVALPFHFFFAFSGILIYAALYFPVAATQLRELHDAQEKQAALDTGLPAQRAGQAAPLASVDAMILEAQRIWQARGMPGQAGSIRLTWPGDANGYVSILRMGSDRVPPTSDGLYFSAATGELLYQTPPPGTISQISSFLSGLHLQHFRHWLLRWLYLVGGLAGCICIATGFLFFVQKRKMQHAKTGSHSGRWVEALAVTTLTGMLLATLSILIASRLLPDALPAPWPERGTLARQLFWASWVLAMAHAFWRSVIRVHRRPLTAWREQSLAVSVLAVVAVLANWLTTGDHLIKTLSEPYWPVAGVDLALLVTALIAALTARQLKRRAHTQALPLSQAHPGKSHA